MALSEKYFRPLSIVATYGYLNFNSLKLHHAEIQFPVALAIFQCVIALRSW